MANRIGLTIASVFAIVLLLAIPYLVHSGAPVPTPTEVAVLSGVLSNGGTIPLPSYADGTAALQNECTWMVGLNTMESTPESISDVYCSADMNRVVHCTGSTAMGTRSRGRRTTSSSRSEMRMQQRLKR